MSNKMWTRNYWNLFSGLFGCENTTSGTVATPTHDVPLVRDGNGVYRRLMCGGNIDYNNGGNVGSALGLARHLREGYIAPRVEGTQDHCEGGNFHVLLGTGTGELSFEAFNLFSPMNSGFTISNETHSWQYKSETHEYEKTIKMAFVYTLSTPITVTEFGVFGLVPTRAYNSSYFYGTSTLMYHELLDEPISLEQNDVIEITFKQSILQPHYADYPSTDA